MLGVNFRGHFRGRLRFPCGLDSARTPVRSRRAVPPARARGRAPPGPRGPRERPAEQSGRHTVARVNSWPTDRWRRAALRLTVTGLVLGAFAASPGPASAQPVQRAGPYVPGELIVRYRPGTRGVAEALSRAGTARRLPGGAMRLRVAGRGSVHEALDRFRRDRDVAYAVRNPTARASGFYPNTPRTPPARARAFSPTDPGFALQWNLAGPYGINMPDAWALASARSAPGGRGVVVAVLDTGVAYRARGRLRRAPDLHSFVRGYDFVDDDPYPLDLNGHGTHVAGTIA